MKRQAVTYSDTRKAWRLLSSARELRSRPAEQAVALVDGFCKLFGADNGFQIGIQNYRPGGDVKTLAFNFGTVVDPMLDRWMQGKLGYEAKPTDDLMAVATIGRTQRTIVQTQNAIWPHAGAHRFPVFAEIIASYRLHDNLVFMFRPGKTADAWGFALHRRGKNQTFSDAHRGLAKLVAGELRRLFDARLITPRPSPTAGLPRRPAEVLERLLAGQSPKQIAVVLGLSVFTVRDHVKFLLERFGVSSTQELLAMLLRPGD